jgi:hypothetical protein
MIFNDKFLKTVRNKQVAIGYTDSDWNYDMYDLIHYLSTHPEEFRLWEHDNKRLGLTKMEFRQSTPDFAKKIIKDLKFTFYKNNISCHAYCGFTDHSKSFEIHKDKMDVLYLQVIGNTEWSIWESDLNEMNITPDQGKCIFNEKFMPGKWIWVPRGTYHFVKPFGPRIGFSFGVEGDPDPSIYI